MAEKVDGAEIGEMVVNNPGGGLAVTLSGITKTYRSGLGMPVAALDGVVLNVHGGEVVAVSGRSGAGKSTLLHLIGAMDRPDRGVVRVGDDEITSLGEGIGRCSGAGWALCSNAFTCYRRSPVWTMCWPR